MVDYFPVSQNRKFLEPEPEPEEDREILEPVIDVVYNVYQEKGDAKTIAVKVSIRLPVKA